MGIIIRNGIPYGAADSKDVTIVAKYSDLADLAVKQSDHIYVVENATNTTSSSTPKTHQSYYYDEDEDAFKPIANINGTVNKILVATGPSGKPADWAVVNSPSYYAVPTRTGETTPGQPTEMVIGTDIPSTMYPAAFGHIGPSTTNPASMPSFSDGYITRDKAIQKIAGAAKINIGEDNSNYSAQTFWTNSLKGPKVDIGGTAVIEMNGNDYAASTPVLTMRGKAILDMSSTNAGGGDWHIYRGNALATIKAAREIFIKTPDAFTNGYYTIDRSWYPFFHMSGSPALIMDNQATLHMQNGSYMHTAGRAHIDIVGTDRYTWPTPANESPYNFPLYPQVGPTELIMGEGSHLIMAGAGQSTHTVFAMNSEQIVLSANHKFSQGAIAWDTGDGGSALLNVDSNGGAALPWGDFPALNNALHGNFVVGGSAVQSKLGDYRPFYELTNSYMQSTWGDITNDMSEQLNGPMLNIRGRTEFLMGDNMGGFAAFHMTPDNGGVALLDWGEQSGGKTLIKLGNSDGTTEFEMGSCGGHQGFQIKSSGSRSFSWHTGSGCKTSIMIRSKNNGINNVWCEVANSDINIQWDKMQTWFNGQDNFVRMDGLADHVEFVGSTFVMSDDSTPGLSSDTTANYPDIYKRYNLSSSTNYSNFTDFKNNGGSEYTAFLNATRPTQANDGFFGSFIDNSTYTFDESTGYLSKDSSSGPKTFGKGNVTCEVEFYCDYFNFKSSHSSYTKNRDEDRLKQDPGLLEALNDLFKPSAGFNITSADITYLNIGYNGTKYGDTLSMSQYLYKSYPTVRVKVNYTTSVDSLQLAASNFTVNHSLVSALKNKIVDEVVDKPSSGVSCYVYDGKVTATTVVDSQTTYPYTYEVRGYWKSTKKRNKSHMGLNWQNPIQTRESGFTRPVFQMHGQPNFMMRSETYFDRFREFTAMPHSTLKQYTFTPTDAYVGYETNTVQFTVRTNSNSYLYAPDIKTKYWNEFMDAFNQAYPNDTLYSIISVSDSYSRVSSGVYDHTLTVTVLLKSVVERIDAEILTFANSVDFAAFEQTVETTYPGDEYKIAYLKAVSGSSDFTVYYDVVSPQTLDEVQRLKTSVGDDPIFEMVGRSEFRMYGGAYIKGESKNGETTYTFGSTTTSEAPVSFTLTELAALKNMLINPPQSFIPLTQAEYDQLDPPNPDTLYVITDGATAQMLPDASVEEF